MEEALRDLGALHGRLDGGLSILKAISDAEAARPGGAGCADASRALWQYMTDISVDMQECLGRAVLALDKI